MEECNEKRKNENRIYKFVKSNRMILIYTMIFTVIMLFLITIFKKYGKSFIWNADGLTQHIANLQSLRQLLINFIKTGEISAFTWNVGTGFDLYGNLAYYNLGDIFSYISIFFHKDKMEVLYNVLVVVRMYFCGIAFLCYCRYKKMNTFPSVIGGLMYTFCTFVLFSAIRHPYFANAVIIFPLAMMGIEKIIIEDKKIFYTVIIASMFTMNFYFAYMLAIILAIYGIILTINTYRAEGTKRVIGVLLKTLLYSILGIMISAVILLPAGIAFLSSERTGGTVYPYTLSHYRNLFSGLLSENKSTYWTCLGVQSIILIALPSFIKKRKENYSLFILMLILFLPLLVSQISSIFCGFGYPNNRWSFALVFIFCFATTSMLHKDRKIERSDLIAIGIFLLTYFAWNILADVQLKMYTQIQLFIFITILLLMLVKERMSCKFRKIQLYHIIFTIVFIIGILSTIKYLYEPEGSNYVSEFLNKGKLNTAITTSRGKISDFGKAIKYLNKVDKGFYKVSKRPYEFDNLPILLDYKGIGSYYSITPRISTTLCRDLNNAEYAVSHCMKEFDYRTKINTLLGVKYYITNNNNLMPYGYSLQEDYKGKSKIYKNNFELPFGVLYTNYITLDEYNNLNSLEKEQSLLKAVAIENNVVKEERMLHSQTENIEIEDVNFKLIDENKINSKNKIQISSENKNTIKLNIGNIKNRELYIQIGGLKYEPLNKKQLIEKSIGKQTAKLERKVVENKYKWYEPNYGYSIKAKFEKVSKSKTIHNIVNSAYYFEMPEILFNLGYYDETSGEIELEFSKVGTYQYDFIKVYAVSMEEYEQDIEKLRQSNFEVLDYGNNYLNGKMNAEKDGILQFSTMYNNGWKVYVDGKEVKTLKANKYFLGIEVEKGSHVVKLEYNNPYIIYGMIITVISIGIFVITIIYNKKKKK